VRRKAIDNLKNVVGLLSIHLERSQIESRGEVPADRVAFVLVNKCLRRELLRVLTLTTKKNKTKNLSESCAPRGTLCRRSFSDMQGRRSL
jgi:hypothetical protein